MNSSESLPKAINNDSDDADETSKLINTNENDEEGEDVGDSIIYNKYFALALMAFSLIGQNFVVDNPAALEDTILETLHVSTEQFSSFYSFYNWPNTIICILNGYVIDRILGCRLSIILFTLIMTVGQICFATGAYFDLVIVMQIGRVIFGLGGESIYVAIFKLVARWFSNSKQLNMAMSFLYCVPNMGSVLNMFVMPLIYNSLNENTLRSLAPNKCLGVALLASDCVSFFSFLSALLLAWIDKKKHKNKKDQDVKATLSFKVILEFPFQFWMFTLTCITYYSVIYPFVGNIKLFYMFKYELPPYNANICNSMVYTVAAVFSPITGLIVDHVGYNLSWLISGVVATILIYLSYAFTYISAYINTVSLGIAFSFVSSSIFPSIPLIMSDDRQGLAYGFIQSIQNFGVAATGTLIGFLVDSKGYFFLNLVFLSYLNVCLVVVTTLFFYDTIKNGILNKSGKEIKCINNK